MEKLLSIVLLLTFSQTFAKESLVGKRAVTTVDGKLRVVTIGSNPDASGNVSTSWIVKDDKCLFGSICNNKSRVIRYKIATNDIEVSSVSARIGGKQQSLKPGILVKNRNGAVFRVDSVFPNGKVEVTQMIPDWTRGKTANAGLKANNELNGLINQSELVAVSVQCTNQSICIGSEVAPDFQLGRPRCMDLPENEQKFGEALRNTNLGCAYTEIVWHAFSDDSLLIANGFRGGVMPVDPSNMYNYRLYENAPAAHQGSQKTSVAE